MILCALIALLLGIGSAKFSAECGNGLGAELRKEEYRKLQGFSFSNIDRFRVSSLVTRLTSDITTVQNTVSSGLRPACRAPVMMLTAIIASFLINAKMAVVFLIATPLLAVLLYLIIRKVRPMYSKLQRAVDNINRIVQENLTAIRVVKAFVRRDVDEEKFREANEERNDPLYFRLRGKADQHRRHGGWRTDGVSQLCFTGTQFSHDDFQCVPHDDAFSCIVQKNCRSH